MLAVVPRTNPNPRDDVRDRDSRSSKGFKAGLVLEQAVSEALDDMGIPHRRTQHRGKEDAFDQLDFIIPSGSGRDLEIQLTLRPKNRPKIFAFARRALTTISRGIRLYVEVVGSHRRAADLSAVGHRVAQAIKTIARRFRNFGSANLLGVRVHAMTGKIEKFDLVEFCGHRLLQLVESWCEERRLAREHEERAAQERHQEAIRAMKERLTRTPPFWRNILNGLNGVPHLLGNHPRIPRPSPHINTRHLFMPRRLC